MIIPIVAALALTQNGVQHHINPHQRVVIIPFVYRGGTKSAVETGRDTVDRFFERAGYDRISINKEDIPWSADINLVGDGNDPLPNLPSESIMRHIGEVEHADLVVAGEIYWHTRSIWVSLGPKTKSTAYVNLKMVALGSHAARTLNVHDVQASDTDEESGFATAASILTGGLVTVVSGGPETPHQQRAAQIALSKAFEPWLEGAMGH
jgi:hypothetical protein